MSRRLNQEARAALNAAGISQAAWARRFFDVEGWYGDVCGCPDDRCIGHHHDRNDECQCLRALVDEANRERLPR